MVPAMDRVSETRARRVWFGCGLGLAVCLIDLGCAYLPWKKPAQEPPMLGRVSDTTDIYAMRRGPLGPSAVPGTILAGNAADSSSPNRAEVDEVGMALKAAEGTTALPVGGVVLQPPTPMDAGPAPKLAKAADGVPNASLVLASSERRNAENSISKAAEVIADARTVLNSFTNYEVSLHRQERVNGTLLSAEDVVLAIRRDPKAVRLTWAEGPNEGREVLYRADEPEGKMHVKMANPALPRLSLPPESPMVMRNSRHPVTEAGLDSIVEGLENALKAAEASGIAYAGLESAEGLDQPHHCLTQTSPSGELWRIYVDPTTHLPSLILAKDANGELLERYLFRGVRPNLPELASNDAFDANARWGQPRGLFGRVARGGSNDPAPTPR
jgi:Protein of unknown function (DUF1571)